MMKPIRALAADLEAGETTARELVEAGLAAIDDPAGEGSRAFISVAADRSRAQAAHYDAMRSAGHRLPPFAGIPFGVKDLADVAGEVTTSGSVALSDAEPAQADAAAVARVHQAGFVSLGRTNMTEFAYSGLGLNEHYDTPASPWDRANRHIPGGSSSGTAVAIADGMVAAGLGTDTGGSCRIPAAYCGIVGYKPTASRVPLDGIYPLSSSLDSVGPLAGTVDCCAIIDDLFAGGDGMVDPSGRPSSMIALAAITNYVTDDVDPVVAARYEAALSRLSAAGVRIDEMTVPELDELPGLNANGGLAGPESFAVHEHLLAERADRYDSRVRPRIEAGSKMLAKEYVALLGHRRRLIAAVGKRLAGYDAFVMPTAANLPPTMSSFGDRDDEGYMLNYMTQNLFSLRNTSVGNFLDACSISMPTGGGDEPVGLMLMANNGDDANLFSISRTIEPLIN